MSPSVEGEPRRSAAHALPRPRRRVYAQVPGFTLLYETSPKKLRIDRIDRIAGGAIETYAVWDYKTGSTYGYDPADPFRQGRLIQPLLYVSIVTHRLQATVSQAARLANFGFFFPGRQAAGQRVSWPATELRAGLHVLEKLCQIIQSGSFLPTNDVDDCRFCDYQAVCGDVEAVTAASQRKLDQADHHPLKELRRDA